MKLMHEVMAGGSRAAGCRRLAEASARSGCRPGSPGCTAAGPGCWRGGSRRGSAWCPIVVRRRERVVVGGICWVVSVTCSTPPLSAENVGRSRPVPWCTGTRPRRSGRANVGLAVAAVGRADQVEERLVFGDREQLPVAEHPARAGRSCRRTSGSRRHTVEPSFLLSSSATGRCPAGRSRRSGSVRLHVLVCLAAARRW